MAGANDDLAQLLTRWATENCPGPGEVRIKARLVNGVLTGVDVRWQPGPGAVAPRQEPAHDTSTPARRVNGGSPELPPAGVFELNELQGDILEALEWKAFNTERLAEAVGVSPRSLFRKPGGVGELQERGLVRNNRRVGYWRPDTPPDDLPEDLAARAQG
jgi:hypothetical protein